MFTVSSASATRCCRLSPESNQGHLFSTHFQYSENATVTCFWWYIIGGICVSSTHGKAAAYVIRLYTYIHIYYTICNGHMQYVYIYIYCVCVTYRALQNNSHPHETTEIPCLPGLPPRSKLWSEVPSIINRNGCFFGRPPNTKFRRQHWIGGRGDMTSVVWYFMGWLFFGTLYGITYPHDMKILTFSSGPFQLATLTKK